MGFDGLVDDRFRWLAESSPHVGIRGSEGDAVKMLEKLSAWDKRLTHWVRRRSFAQRLVGRLLIAGPICAVVYAIASYFGAQIGVTPLRMMLNVLLGGLVVAFGFVGMGMIFWGAFVIWFWATGSLPDDLIFLSDDDGDDQ